jgi:hypothetical protein
MVVVAKFSSTDDLARIQITPYWWMMAHWHEHYPLELHCRVDITMRTVKGRHHPDEYLAYCPSWAIGKKKG